MAVDDQVTYGSMSSEVHWVVALAVLAALLLESHPYNNCPSFHSDNLLRLFQVFVLTYGRVARTRSVFVRGMHRMLAWGSWPSLARVLCACRRGFHLLLEHSKKRKASW